MKTSVPRLIKNFIPANYKIELDLEREKRAFSGKVVISGEFIASSGPLKLHAKELEITEASIDGDSATIAFDELDTINLSQEKLSPGEHVVELSFSGKITDSMHGLYPCYFKVNGQKKELLATQLESHHAREVFPCVDEPEAKATFDVTLSTEKDQTVLGNMPVKTQKDTGDKLITTFSTTPKMSSYLLAFVVGELHKKTAVSKNGVEVNVWATLAQPAESLDFGLDIATRTIDFLDDFFDVKYPLPKADHVALPDFSSGAMENWGLITYRESCLLASKADSSVEDYQYNATVIAHELSHQWFGNLVTMQWWDDLWLNESFATLMEHIIVDNLEPSWNIWNSFLTNDIAPSMRRDSTAGVQAVKQEVNHPDEISTLFDPAIVYAKGARLLRMLHGYIGERAFKAGLKKYFADFAYKNARGDDLWRSLEEVSHKPIMKLMNSWLNQSGLPVVSLSTKDNKITLQQERFFIGQKEENQQEWQIPLFSNATKELPETLTKKEETFTLKEDQPIHLNNDYLGHFVTLYPKPTLNHLLTQVKDNKLNTINELALLNDLLLLAEGGKMPSAELIPTVEFYQQKTNPEIWSMISAALANLRKFVFDDEKAEVKLKELYLKTSQSLYTKIGWDENKDEAEDVKKLRRIIIGMTLHGENEEAAKKARAIFNENDLEAISPGIRSLVISSVVRHQAPDDMSLIEQLVDTYGNTNSTELKTDICAGLTDTKDVAVLKLLLEKIKDSKIVRPQDAYFWFAYAASNKHGRKLGLDWLINNWNWVNETFGSDKSYSFFIRILGRSLLTTDELERFKEFFLPKTNDISIERTILMAAVEIEGRIDLISKNAADVKARLLAL